MGKHDNAAALVYSSPVFPLEQGVVHGVCLEEPCHPGIVHPLGWHILNEISAKKPCPHTRIHRPLITMESRTIDFRTIEGFSGGYRQIPTMATKLKRLLILLASVGRTNR